MVVVVVVVVAAMVVVVVVVALELRRLGFGFRTGREATRVNKLLPLLLLLLPPGRRKGWPRASEGWRRGTTEKRDGYMVLISGVADVKLEKPENLDNSFFRVSFSLSFSLSTHVRRDAPGHTLHPSSQETRV